MHFCYWTVALLSPLHLNERKPGIFLFSASKRCLHTCMITMTPPCPCASRLNPPSVLESTECLWRCDSPTTNWTQKETPEVYCQKKCWWALNQSKAALAEECEEAAMEQGLQDYPEVLSALGQARQHFCKWWKSFFYKASHSANQAPDSRGQVSKIWLEVTCACLVGYAGKEGTSIDDYIYLGDGFFPTILDEAWKLFLPEGT